MDNLRIVLDRLKTGKCGFAGKYFIPEAWNYTGYSKFTTDEVIPTFYNDREKWTSMMRASIEMSQWKFSAARMMKEYYELMYIKPELQQEELAACCKE